MEFFVHSWTAVSAIALYKDDLYLLGSPLLSCLASSLSNYSNHGERLSWHDREPEERTAPDIARCMGIFPWGFGEDTHNRVYL